MRSIRRSFPVVAGLLFAGVMVVSGIAPALAAPPYPVGARATALVGGTPLIQSTCPTAAAQPPAGGTSTAGPISVGGPAGARCTGSSASADGVYAIAGVTPPLPTTLRFSAQCESNGGNTFGGVDVPAGTIVNGVAVTTQTTVSAPNTPVTYSNGSTAILNRVTTTNTSVTREAIVFTGGPGSGTIVGQVVCGQPLPYPLSVDTPAVGDAAPAVALPAPGLAKSDSSQSRLLLIGGAVGLLVLAQLAVGRNMMKRRRGLTES